MRKIAPISIIFVAASAVMAQPNIPPPAPPVIRPAPPPIQTSPLYVAQVPPLATDDTSETIHVQNAGNWQIRVDLTLNGGCFAVVRYSNDTLLRVFMDPIDSKLQISIGNWRWRSLKTDQSYPITLQFNGREPWDGEAFVLRYYRINSLALQITDPEFLEEMMKAENLRLDWDGRTINYFTMDGSRAALTALADCQGVVDEIINDPFAK